MAIVTWNEYTSTPDPNDQTKRAVVNVVYDDVSLAVQSITCVNPTSVPITCRAIDTVTRQNFAATVPPGGTQTWALTGPLRNKYHFAGSPDFLAPDGTWELGIGA